MDTDLERLNKARAALLDAARLMDPEDYDAFILQHSAAMADAESAEADGLLD